MRHGKIIAIGGASGVSKSSTARFLSNKFGFVHTLGSGFIREIVRASHDRKECPELFKYSFDASDDEPWGTLERQSIWMASAMRAVTTRAYEEGTDLIIEGVNVIPGILDWEGIALRILLVVRDEAEHFKMINGETHRLRFIDRQQFEVVRKIQDELTERAHHFGWQVLDPTTEGTRLRELVQIAMLEREN